MPNQYLVYLYLREFNPLQSKYVLSDCELGFDKDTNRYYLSTVISADFIEEAQRKGEKRLYEVLKLIEISVGITYPVIGIQTYLLSGKDIFSNTFPMTLKRRRYVPLDSAKLDEIKVLVELHDKIAKNNENIKKMDRIVDYYIRGCSLETTWQAESFLNFYKIIEFISQNFVKDFDADIKNQTEKTLLNDLTDEEIKALHSHRRLIQYMCKKLAIQDEYDVKQIVRSRHQFSAHANLEEPVISTEAFNSCKFLAGQALLNYVKLLI